MSILKRLLSEDLPSVLRNAPSRHHAPVPEPAASAPAPPARGGARSARAGMKTVILNWKSGENDPFTVVNGTIRRHLHACGKEVEIVEISSSEWPDRLAGLAAGGVDFVFTWQGLGSRAKTADGSKSLWDHLRIPLICVHGDHPSHMPPNHELESPYCVHLYNNAEFARYSNRHFRRIRSASVIDIPQLHREPRLSERTGDYFVIAKNIDDPVLTERAWRERLDRSLLDV
jgi:hypothetical protein